MNKSNLSIILPSVGALAGLTYAFKKKSGFWGYVGYFVVGGLAGSLITSIIAPETVSINVNPPSVQTSTPAATK